MHFWLHLNTCLGKIVLTTGSCSCSSSFPSLWHRYFSMRRASELGFHVPTEIAWMRLNPRSDCLMDSIPDSEFRVFSFSPAGCPTKVKEFSLIYYFTHNWGGEDLDSRLSQRALVQSKCKISHLGYKTEQYFF